MAKYDKVGINEKTKEILINDGYFLSQSEYGTQENLYIIRTLENYTLEVNKNLIQEFYDKEKKLYICNINGCNIPFELASESLENIPEKIKGDLETYNRYKKCHLNSISTSSCFKNSKILTGIIKLEKEYVLHSVLEVIDPYSKQVKIIDWTRNLILEKEAYLKLFEFHIIGEIESKNILEDSKLFLKLGMAELSTKIYLAFGNEIRKDLNKNSFLIEEGEERKNTR